jgi:basic membrane lipoprotein Med (substrate-binding protein (PBP1-ABC) superfamily)
VGLRDAIKVYEYLNWFYVIEGNKRVSVLKYLDVFSYPAHVIRMIPKYDEQNKDIRIYYAFLKFFKHTKLNTIWFSEEKRFGQLWKLIRNYEPSNRMVKKEERFKYFQSAVYGVFRKVYLELGGQNLPITTGDAFLDYIKINGVPDQFFEDELRPSLKRFIVELDYYKQTEDIEVQTEPVVPDERNIFDRLTSVIRPESKIKVGFALAKDILTSSWTYAHELGRMHLERVMADQVQTLTVNQVPETTEAYHSLLQLVNQGCQVVFTTSPAFINATLRIAMEYPGIVFLNCSNLYSFKHVRTYFGRIHEPRFLSGIIAGTLTRADRLGYIATCPTAEVISGVNAFALGAKMVNPRTEVFLEWTGDWDNQESSVQAGTRLTKSGVDIISHHNTLANRKFSREYGVYTFTCNIQDGACTPDRYLAVPVWNWGIFYEKMVRSILGGMTRPAVENSGKKQTSNYWWGMDSGILDFFYSRKLVPIHTQKLISLVRDAIIDGSFQVFAGPLIDQNGIVRIADKKAATREEILSMGWLLDFVHGEIPNAAQNLQSELSTGRL